MSFPENGNLKEKDILVLPLDLTDTSSHEAATKAVLQEFGKIDILVNNGGRSQRSLVLETNLEVFKELMNLNYLGTVSLTKCVLPHMVERKQGKIVTVNSLAGIASVSLSSGYCASKHALRGFFNALHSELGKYPGITLCNVYPGPVQSNVVKNALTEELTKPMRCQESTMRMKTQLHGGGRRKVIMPSFASKKLRERENSQRNTGTVPRNGEMV